MEKNLRFIQVYEFKSKKNNKNYYKLITFNEELKTIKEEFISENIYKQIKDLNLDFADDITINYNINQFNNRAYIASVE